MIDADSGRFGSVENLFEALWEKFGREVSVSFAGRTADERFPWSVMVEGDIGSYAGASLIDALAHRLESPPPERQAGWGQAPTDMPISAATTEALFGDHLEATWTPGGGTAFSHGFEGARSPRKAAQCFAKRAARTGGPRGRSAPTCRMSFGGRG